MTEHKNIYMALAAAQAEMGSVKKGSVNPAFKSKYADLADVVAAVSPALNAQGIAFYATAVVLDGERYMRTVFAHGASDTQIHCDVPLIVTKNDMQGFKSATTYAKRIGLESLSGVAPEDDDGNAAAKAAPRYVPRVDVSPADSDGRSNREIKDAHGRMLRMLQACNTVDDLQGWLTVNQDDLGALPEDVAEDLRGQYRRRRDELKAIAV